MELRRAVPADLDTLIALGRRCYAEHFHALWNPRGLEAYLASQYERASVARGLASESTTYELAIEAGEPIGFAKTLRDRPIPDGRGRTGLELEKIYLTAASSGRGYGAALLARVIAIAEQVAEEWVWLDVLKSNAAGIRFYERAGFARVAEVPFATDVREIGMWVMCRATRP